MKKNTRTYLLNYVFVYISNVCVAIEGEDTCVCVCVCAYINKERERDCLSISLSAAWLANIGIKGTDKGSMMLEFPLPLPLSLSLAHAQPLSLSFLSLSLSLFLTYSTSLYYPTLPLLFSFLPTDFVFQQMFKKHKTLTIIVE